MNLLKTFCILQNAINQQCVYVQRATTKMINGKCLCCACRFIPGPWTACSVSCGLGIQRRLVKCKVLLSFTQTEVELPIEECDEEKPPSQRACDSGPCSESPDSLTWPLGSQEIPEQHGYDWEYMGFTACSASCAAGESPKNPSHKTTSVMYSVIKQISNMSLLCTD